jgi:RNase H-like domain found in reverse transcriptase
LKIATPLTDLIRDTEKSKFSINLTAVTAFESLKMKYTEAPLLTIFDFEKPFTVDTDALDRAVAEVHS